MHSDDFSLPGKIALPLVAPLNMNDWSLPRFLQSLLDPNAISLEVVWNPRSTGATTLQLSNPNEKSKKSTKTPVYHRWGERFFRKVFPTTKLRLSQEKEADTDEVTYRSVRTCKTTEGVVVDVQEQDLQFCSNQSGPSMLLKL